VIKHNLSAHFESIILSSTGASGMQVVEVLQNLWSGYGSILRVRLEDSDVSTVVVKHVRAPVGGGHPRGWNSSLSHERKIKSYQVETAWYRNWGDRCGEQCRIPKFLAFDREGSEVLLVLEDLDAAGFPGRRGSLGPKQVEICLQWLANFHATFMGATPEGLWKVGTYWHLATRPEEREALEDIELKGAAEAIDRRLNQAEYQTLVHGDAKLANFCFSKEGDQVAAVDFQYVGGGCGMKDVAYFIGSCLDETSCEAQETALLDSYFSALRKALANEQPQLDADALISEWRNLFPLAWTDFHRFLKGWSPGHWKLNSYSERVAREVLASLASH
jgi:hypothetical protein